MPQQVFPGGYQLSLTTNVLTPNDWLSSATGCSNIEFDISDFPNCGLTYFPALVVDDVYLGPQTFEYFGMTCTASLAENTQAFQYSGTTNGGFLGCSGLVRPSSEGEVISRIVQGNNFSITIEFPVPVNDIPVRASVLNSNEDGTGGDVYYVETNGGTPTLSINQGCFAQVEGNRLWGGVANPPIEPVAYSNEGDGEFKVTAPTSYTYMTIYGNAPTGGSLFLGCPPVALNCNRIFTARVSERCEDQAGICAPENTSGRYLRVYSQNITTNIVEEVVLPAGSYFTLPNSDITDNYYIGVINQNFSTGLLHRWTRYEYSSSPSGVPSNIVWENILYEINPSDLPGRQGTLAGMSTINDNTFVIDNFNKTKTTSKTFLESNMNKFFYYHGKQAVIDIINFRIIKSKKVDKTLYDLREQFRVKEIPIMPIGANMLKSKYRMADGRVLGNKLKMIEEEWVKSNFKISEKQINNIINN